MPASPSDAHITTASATRPASTATASPVAALPAGSVASATDHAETQHVQQAEQHRRGHADPIRRRVSRALHPASNGWIRKKSQTAAKSTP